MEGFRRHRWGAGATQDLGRLLQVRVLCVSRAQFLVFCPCCCQGACLVVYCAIHKELLHERIRANRLHVLPFHLSLYISDDFGYMPRGTNGALRHGILYNAK